MQDLLELLTLIVIYYIIKHLSDWQKEILELVALVFLLYYVWFAMQLLNSLYSIFFNLSNTFENS